MVFKKTWRRWALASSLFVIAVIALVFLKKKLDVKGDQAASRIMVNSSNAKVVEKDGVTFREANWKDLVQLDYHTGARPAAVKEIENQRVRIPGYIVPLTDDVAVLDEFLFVPNDQACIHVPPPPPNLIVKAKLKQKLPFEDVYNPSWLYGKLEIVDTKSQYGQAAYQINDAFIEKYDETTE